MYLTDIIIPVWGICLFVCLWQILQIIALNLFCQLFGLHYGISRTSDHIVCFKKIRCCTYQTKIRIIIYNWFSKNILTETAKNYKISKNTTHYVVNNIYTAAIIWTLYTILLLCIHHYFLCINICHSHIFISIIIRNFFICFWKFLLPL